jgi:hypothetical protein
MTRQVHPNQRLSAGRGHLNQSRRERVRELVQEWVDKKSGLPLSFAAIADELGISRERVRQLAWEEAGVRGRVKRRGEVKLRGQRRFFEKVKELAK